MYVCVHLDIVMFMSVQLDIVMCMCPYSCILGYACVSTGREF